MTRTARGLRRAWLMAALCGSGVLLAVAGLNAKLLVDGYGSHVVGAQLRIARYAWLTGDFERAAAQMWRTAPTALEAGVRWQVAQGYLYLAQIEGQRGNRAEAVQHCHAAQRVLGFGRFGHTRRGTSHFAHMCDVLE